MANKPDWTPVGDSTTKILEDILHEGDQIEYQDETWHKKFDNLMSYINTKYDLYKTLQCKDT